MKPASASASLQTRRAFAAAGERCVHCIGLAG